MYAVLVTDEGGAQRRLDFSKPELSVGRVQGNDIVLAKRNVSKQHARLSLQDERAVVTDLNSTNGTWVNGRRISSPHPVKLGDKIYIADFILTLEPANDREDETKAREISEPLVPTDVPPAAPTSRPGEAELLPEVIESSQVEHATSLPPTVERRPTDEASVDVGSAPTDTLAALMARLADRIDVQDVKPASMQKQSRWSAARAAIAETFLAMQNDGSVSADANMREIAHIALHEAVGLGALDDALSNEAVKTIVVQGPRRILMDTGAGLRATELSFSSPETLSVVARRLAAQTGRELGSDPFYGRLSFGPSLTILQEPVVSHGPLIEIRVGQDASLEELVRQGWIGPEGAAYLGRAVADSRNVLVAGPSGSGVTTVLSALAREIPPEEPTVAIEHKPDLGIDRTAVVSLCAGTLGVPMRDAIALGATLRASHLVIDDLTGASLGLALATLEARTSGHLLGVRCGADSDVLRAMMAAAGCEGADTESLAAMIGAAVDVVVVVHSGPDGSRIASISEVEGTEGLEVRTQSIPL